MKNTKCYKFINNYVDEARKDTPKWLTYFKFKCIECGYQPIYLKEDICPCCEMNFKKQINNDVSINIGISILDWLKTNYKEGVIDLKNENIKGLLEKQIIDALPVIDEVKLNESNYLPKMYVLSNGRVQKDEKLCNELIQYYFEEFKNCRYKKQQISKISVRKLFGYHSYNLHLENDLSIVYGTNGLGKTTIFKILECIFIRPKDNRFSKNSNSAKLKALQNVLYLLEIPFEVIRIDFKSDDYVSVIKHTDDQGNYELNFDYPPYGFDSTQTISGINMNMGAEELYIAINGHYNNIDKLFPDINNYKKFLFVKVNRFLDAKTDTITFKKFNSISTSDLHKMLLPLDEPKFLIDFMKSLKSITEELNSSFNKCFSTKRKFLREIQFTSDELFSFIEENYDEGLMKELETQDSLINKINESKLHRFILGKKEKEKYLKYRDDIDLEKIFEASANKKIDGNAFITNLLKFAFNSRHVIERTDNFKSMIESMKNITKFYKNYLLLKELFENLYYEFDPSRKKLIYQNGSLCLKTNAFLNDDFSKNLSVSSLSSGELNIITILYNLIFKTTRNSIVLIDEPEVSLHIAWQQSFAYLVKDIMKINPGMQVIIASHSPFLTSGHDEYFVGADLVEEGK